MLERYNIYPDGGFWEYDTETNVSKYIAHNEVIYTINGKPIILEDVAYAIPFHANLEYDEEGEDKIVVESTKQSTHVLFNYKGTNKLIPNVVYDENSIKFYDDDFFQYKKDTGVEVLAYYDDQKLDIATGVVVCDELIRLSQYVFRAKSNNIYYAIQLIPVINENGESELKYESEPISTVPYEVRDLGEGKYAFVGIVNGVEEVFRYL